MTLLAKTNWRKNLFVYKLTTCILLHLYFGLHIVIRSNVYPNAADFNMHLFSCLDFGYIGKCLFRTATNCLI